MQAKPGELPKLKVQAAQDMFASTSALQLSGLNKAEQFGQFIADLKFAGKPTTQPAVTAYCQEITFASDKDNWSKSKTYQDVKNVWSMFVQNAKAHTALKAGELVFGQGVESWRACVWPEFVHTESRACVQTARNFAHVHQTHCQR